MKALVFCIGFFILLLIFACRKDVQPYLNHLTNRNAIETGVKANMDSLLEVLLSYENAIYNRPDDSSLFDSFLKASFDTNSGLFFTVGKGVYNREFPESAWEPSRKNAASYDGKRWALYLKARHTGQRIRFGDKIEGEVVYSKNEAEKIKEDTLFLLQSIPVGSIVVKGSSGW